MPSLPHFRVLTPLIPFRSLYNNLEFSSMGVLGSFSWWLIFHNNIPGLWIGPFCWYVPSIYFQNVSVTLKVAVSCVLLKYLSYFRSQTACVWGCSKTLCCFDSPSIFFAWVFTFHWFIVFITHCVIKYNLFKNNSPPSAN